MLLLSLFWLLTLGRGPRLGLVIKQSDYSARGMLPCRQCDIEKNIKQLLHWYL